MDEAKLQRCRDIISARMPAAPVAAARKLEAATGQGEMWRKVYSLWESPAWKRDRPSVMLSGLKGCGKTTAMVGVGCRETLRGRYAWYVPITGLARLIKLRDYAKPTIDQMRSCPLILLDQLHYMNKLPGWVLLELIDIIDWRYMQPDLQTIASGTLPEDGLGTVVGWEIMERFDVMIDSAEVSYR